MASSQSEQKDIILPPIYCSSLTNAEIIAYCADPPSEALDVIPLGGYSNSVIPLSDHEVVKYGPGVYIEEYKNLQHAYRLLDPSIYMKGTLVGEIADDSRIEKVGKALQHFSSFRNSKPGPLGGGVSRGLLWGEGTTTEYSLDGSAERLAHWVNRRIEHQELSLSFQECDFVLCHLDIAPRNIVWLHGDSLCIVDWASAGYYPRIFEWCLLDIVCGKDGPFQDLVKKTLEPMTEWENKSWPLIEKA